MKIAALLPHMEIFGGVNPNIFFQVKREIRRDKFHILWSAMVDKLEKIFHEKLK